MLLGEIVERVAVEPAGVEVEAHDERVVIRRDTDAAPFEDHPVELEIMPDLEDRGIFEQRLEPFEHQRGRQLRRAFGEQIVAAMLQRDVARPVGPDGEADTYQLGGDAVAAVGLGIDRDSPFRGDVGDPAVERRFVGHGFVQRAVDLRLRRGFGLRR